MTTTAGDPAGLEQVILRLLDRRAPGGSICPSDAARAARPDSWRDLMDDVRAAAARLAAQGMVDITQGGHVVDPATARGPVRIRRHLARLTVARSAPGRVPSAPPSQ